MNMPIAENFLAVETDYLEGNRDELTEKYGNQFLLIMGDQVIDAFKSESKAIAEGVRRFGSEPFLVRRPQDETETFDIPALSLGLL